MHGIDPGLVLAGFLVGGLIGLSGIGGGSLMAPILILVAGVGPVQAVGTDFVYSAITKVFGSYRHWRLTTVDLRLGLRLAAGSVPGVVLGSLAVHWLSHHAAKSANAFVSHALGVALVLTAVAIAWRLVRPPSEAAAAARRPWRRWVLIPVCFLLGLLVGVTSVGSGSLFVVLLVFGTGLPMRRVVGTDIFHAMLLTGAGAVVNLGARTVDPGVTLNLLIGSLPGVWLGSGLTAHLPRRALSGTVALLIGLTGLRLI